VYQLSPDEVAPALEKEILPTESKETAGEVAASDEKKEVVVSIEGNPAAEELKAPAQTSGTQSNGNTDVVALTTTPVLITEGDRA
jgi:hypothetical protein